MLALAVSYGAVSAIRREESRLGAALFSLKSGISDYSILSGGRCAGTIQTQLTHHRSAELDAQIQLIATLGGNTTALEVNLAALFNPLLQLHDASLQINSERFNIKLKATDANPLKILLDATVDSKIWHKSFNMPGPIMLKQDRLNSAGNTFSLQYRAAGNASASRLLEAIKPVLEPLAINIEPGHRCKSSSGAVDLAPLLARLYESPMLREILTQQEAGLR